jgi:predicted CoA-binding protein
MKTVAVLGASSDRNKFGNKAVRAFRDCGYQVYPINAKETVIEGFGAFPSLQAVPTRPDIVSVYLPPPVLLSLLPGLAAVGIVELWLNPGTDTPEVISALRRLNIPFLQACSLVRLGVNPSDY